MKVSYRFLSSVLPLDGISPKEIADKLTFAGVEVESIETLASGTNLTIGKIISCLPHPDSDHLHILQVDEGQYGVHQIVCGAPNAREGLKVIVAREGAKLPGGEIKPSVIRGVNSDGMCCSLLELGVGKKTLSQKQTEGIEELPDDAPLGIDDVLGYLGLDDSILDISVLPNRPDLYSLYNVAREVSCLFSLPLALPKTKKANLDKSEFKIESLTSSCPIFSARVIRGIKKKESPRWLSSFLNSLGIRSIDAVVDIGNYVMLLTGQPINMYDYDKLKEKKLTIADSYEGPFLAMDGNSYDLIKGDILISSGDRPACLAGIMTSDEARIDENSVNVVVEAAYFSYANIRHTSNRIGLSSDSSLRFCKGINPSQMEEVQDLATSLLIDICGAEIAEETVLYDVYPHEDKIINTSLGYINGRLGTSFDLDTVKKILERDHFEVETKGEELTVKAPSYRIDLDGEADISEEIIRIAGYSNVPSSLPSSSSASFGLTPSQEKEKQIKTMLLHLGISEALTYSLVSEEETNKFALLYGKEPLKLANPMTKERECLRTGLIHSLLAIASYNASRQNKDGAFFEVSDIDTLSSHSKSLSIVCFGDKKEWGDLKKRPYDFYDLKGYMEAIFDILGLTANRYQISRYDLSENEFHPGRSAKITMGKKVLGAMGELHPNALKEYGLKGAVALELDLSALLELKVSPVKADIPPRFPSSSRDLALLVDIDLPYADIEREIKRVDSLIKEVSIFDVYTGAGILPNKKSLAVSIVFSCPDRTLKDEEIDAIMDKLILSLKAKLNAEIRK